MTVDVDELAEMRAEAEEAMPDLCRITRPSTGGQTLDPATGRSTPAAPTVIYEGPCQLGIAQGGQEVQFGGEQLVVFPTRLRLPVSASGVQVDDRAEMLASLDPSQVGVSYRTRWVEARTYSVVRTLHVEVWQ